MNNAANSIAISVVLPVYNGGEYLKQSVESVLMQDLQNFEFLILDDCSTDGSYEYLQGLKDDRIQLFRNEHNKGLFYNLNFLIKHARSPLIKLWAQDDIMYPDCLSGFVSFHKSHPQIGFSYSGRTIIDENGDFKENDRVDTTPEIISTELHARIAYYTGSIAGNIANVCIDKNALERVGPFNESMKISADFDMWVRLAEHYETGFIKKNLIKLRDHSGQLSRNENYYINHIREDIQVYRYLDNYVNNSLKEEGGDIIKKQKLIFYYTLMVKNIAKGKLSLAYEFYKELSGYTNFINLTAIFVRKKVLRSFSKF